MKVKNEKELGKALFDGENTIEVEGDLANQVIRIKATGKVAWGVLIGGMAIAIPLVYITVASTGTSSIITVPALAGVMAPSIATLGVGATVSAVSIAAGASIAAGGVSKISAGVAGLRKLRQYKITKNEKGITLNRK